jgi:hypothetical protein
MIIASGWGLNLDPDFLAASDPFAEQPGRYIIQLRESAFDAFNHAFRQIKVAGKDIYPEPDGHDPFVGILGRHFGGSTRIDRLGFVQRRPSLLILKPRVKLHQEITVEELTAAWRGTLDW